MRTSKRVLMLVAATMAAAFALSAAGAKLSAFAQGAKKEELSESYRGSQQNNVEYQKIAPFKVLDNLYYVGPGFVSAWLVPTTQGVIMIDTAQEPYVDHVMDSIKKSGFALTDIKYIILSHGHLDHFGGAARIQEASGARVVALEEDWRLIEAAGSAPGRGGAPSPRVPKRDMVVKEGDMLSLGGQTMKFYKHPGHTPGSLSIEFTVYDNGEPHKAFVFGGPGPRGGVAGGQQFLESVDRVAQIPGIEVAVNVHSWLASYPFPNGGILERRDRLAQRKPGEPNPFVDAASWQQWLKLARDGAVKNVEAEKLKATK